MSGRKPREVTALDAAGREMREGDRVGGTTSGRYQETVVGNLDRIGKGQIKIRVEQSTRSESGGFGTKVGEFKWISIGRVFLVESRA